MHHSNSFLIFFFNEMFQKVKKKKESTNSTAPSHTVRASEEPAQSQPGVVEESYLVDRWAVWVLILD